MRRGLLAGVLVAMLWSSSATAQSSWTPRPRAHMTVRLLGALRARDVPMVPADARPVRLVDAGGVPSAVLRRAEVAVEDQVNRQVRRYWSVPAIYFSPRAGDWSLSVIAKRDNRRPDEGGWHDSANGVPHAVVVWNGNESEFTEDLSHEVIETLVDPSANAAANGWLLDACDPVLSPYRVDGELVSDFVLPVWFTPNSRGPWDYRHVLRWAQQVGEYAYRQSGTGFVEVIG